MIFVNPYDLVRIAGHEFERLRYSAYHATQKLRAAIDSGQEPSFNSAIWKHVRPLLRALFHGKCAYCESSVDVSGYGDVEMFRPKKLYPTLAYEWRNMLYACAVCNQRYKKDQFPLTGEKAQTFQIRGPAEPNAHLLDLSGERPLLLNPYDDLPHEHLVFTVDAKAQAVQVAGLTDRGSATIDILGLNRPELLKARFETWTRVLTLLDIIETGKGESSLTLSNATITEVMKSVSSSAVYAGAIRQLCRSWIEDADPKLGRKHYWKRLFDQVRKSTILVSSDLRRNAFEDQKRLRRQLRSYSVDAAKGDTLDKFNFGVKRIDRIEVKNLRVIPHLDFTFPAMAERESWVMLIGENGVGKSTLLQGVALALMGEERANQYGLDASQFVRRGTSAGFVSVHINTIGQVTLRFENDSKKFTVDPPKPKVPLLAYGPTRLLPSETPVKPLTDRNIRTDNLFKPTVPMSDAESWLVKTRNEDQEAFRNIGQALCRLLLLSDETPPRMNRDNRLEIKMPDGWRRISDLSSGYRSILALVVDIAIGTSGKRRKVEEAVGIVLLDEIEVHLHPAWKISIVERLRNVFPQMSFLATTHDPLCLKGLYDREIVTLRRGRRGLVTFATDLPSVHSLKSDDILTSKEFFDLPSSRNTTSPISIARYSILLNKPSLSENERQELERLRREISDMLSGTLNPMQREVERAVTAVIKELRSGNTGRQLIEDVVAEIRRQATAIGVKHD
jgi:uncharacterized protein (TIGR02646 family)